MRVLVFCTLSTGLEAIDRALALGVPITKVIGLAPCEQRDGDQVSGYVDIAPFCQQRGLAFAYARSYALKDEDAGLLDPGPDLIWVTGWQRLLPPWVLAQARLGGLGLHGSCDGIRLGRGRSPQNWALIMGKAAFDLSLFCITPGVDAGPVVASRRFALSQSDTIRDSYWKVAHASAEMLAEVVQDPGLLTRAQPQQGPAAYFPKRTAEDGLIDWRQEARDLANLVRALAHPYPQARLRIGTQELRIERASATQGSQDAAPGQVVAIQPGGSVVVQTGKGALQIEALAEGQGCPHEHLNLGDLLDSADARGQVATMLQRFAREFPGERLNSSLHEFWKTRGLL